VLVTALDDGCGLGDWLGVGASVDVLVGDGAGAAVTVTTAAVAVGCPDRHVGSRAMFHAPATRVVVRDVLEPMVNCVRTPLTSMVVIVGVWFTSVTTSAVVTIAVEMSGTDVHDTPESDPVNVIDWTEA
jgi:hypothetical protein